MESGVLGDQATIDDQHGSVDVDIRNVRYPPG
jgi:hypothetical protein